MLLFLPLELFDFDNIRFHISYLTQHTRLIDQNNSNNLQPLLSVGNMLQNKSTSVLNFPLFSAVCLQLKCFSEVGHPVEPCRTS